MHGALPVFCCSWFLWCGFGFCRSWLELVFCSLGGTGPRLLKPANLLEFFLPAGYFSGTANFAAANVARQHFFLQHRHNKKAFRRPDPGRLLYAPPTIPHILAAHFAAHGGNGFPTLPPPNPPSLFFSLMAAPSVVLPRFAPPSH